MQCPSTVDFVITSEMAAKLYPSYKMERARQLKNLVCRRSLSPFFTPQWAINERAAQIRHAQRELADLRRNWSSVVAAGAPRMINLHVRVACLLCNSLNADECACYEE